MTDSDFETWLDEFVNQTIENWVTMNSRPPSREDLIEHCLRLGAKAAWAKAKEKSDKLAEALKFVCSEFETAKEDPDYWYKEEVEPKVIQILRGE